jgi:hypothetical protein
MYGDYPVSDLRFADSEAAAERVYTKDLQNAPSGGHLSLGPFKEGAQPRSATEVEVGGRTAAPGFLEVFGDDHRLLKRIDYEYSESGDAAHLQRQRVHLPERPVIVGLRDDGVTVTFRGTTRKYRDFAAAYEKGGRYCLVDYQTVRWGSTEARLPARVEVRSSPDGPVLRTARFLDFQPTTYTAEQAQRAARDFVAPNLEFRRLEQLSKKYAPPSTNVLSESDLTAAKDLRRNLFGLSGQKATIGEELRRLSALAVLNNMLRDDRESERVYRRYLSLLAKNDLPSALLVGGSQAIRTACSSDRRELASRMLDHWVDAAATHIDVDTVLSLLKRQPCGLGDWEAMRLLTLLCSRASLDAHVRFQLAALRCLACARLRALLLSSGESSEAALACSMTNANQLARMQSESMLEARGHLMHIDQLDDSERALESKLRSLGMPAAP